MKKLYALTAFLAAFAARPAVSQDVMKVASNHYRVLLENEYVRVVENTLAPGEKDAMHTHPAGWYYITRPGRMEVVFASGKREVWQPATGESGWSPAEEPHTSKNIGNAPMSYVLVELKSPQTAAQSSR